jgi:hypothetical protein
VSTLEIKAAEPATVALDTLTLDAELQCRAKGTNKATVAEYAEALRAGAVFPAIVVFRDAKGAVLLADGWHRVEAAREAGLTELPADIREGGRKEALLFSAASNATHGLRRTNSDKRRAVMLVLAACPRWADRRIAEACGVGNKFVGDVRREVCPEHSSEREGLDGKVRHVAAEGEQVAEPQPSEEDAAIARLSKALSKLVAQWPASRRAELQERLLEAATAPSG